MQAEPDVKVDQSGRQAFAHPLLRSGLTSGPVLRKEVSESIILAGQ